jgi:hypothetical protein
MKLKINQKFSLKSDFKKNFRIFQNIEKNSFFYKNFKVDFIHIFEAIFLNI